MAGHLPVCRFLVGARSKLWLQPSTRWLTVSSQAREHVWLSTEEREGHMIATITLHRPPVNSFNIPFASQLASTLKELQHSSAEALIVKSSQPTTFSAGLDLNVLHGISEDDLRTFWTLMQDTWYYMYSSRLAKVAMINGHCLAGGTIIAAACDYRVAAQGQYGIGVTAARIGLIAPPWFLKTLTYLMGQRNTELYLQLGKAFTPDEALSVGLVDEVCAPNDLEETCYRALQPFLAVSQDARAKMAYYLREEVLEQFLATREQDLERFVNFVMSDSVQHRIGKFIEQLKKP